jgi:hemin uptake protein HemP
VSITTVHDVHAPLAPVPQIERTAASVRRVPSQQLLAGARELLIEHAGSEYRLRITRNGKLILTK